jgi:hypothetical protein
VREKRVVAYARAIAAHRVVEVVERTEPVRRRTARVTGNLSPERRLVCPGQAALSVVHEHHFARAQKTL